MQIVRSVGAAGAHTRTKRRVLVPTMGALHRGHGELIRIAREVVGSDGEVAVSIFVNPLQFGPSGDYEKYPRRETEDEEFCREAGVNILFRPRRARCRPRSAADRGPAIFAASAPWSRNFFICSHRTRRCLAKKIFNSSPSFDGWCAI